jgi:hypoxanthine-DNA glycosylase
MKRIRHTFGPVAPRDARILILGTMPSVESLRRNQYYAHPRNQFWPIMGKLFGTSPNCPYRERLSTLRRNNVALWDVLAECTRHGSLDANIGRGDAVPNDIVALLWRYRGIRAVFFNGQTAAALFRRFVFPLLGERAMMLSFYVLPSTSPAHAGMSAKAKLARWRPILRWLRD